MFQYKVKKMNSSKEYGYIYVRQHESYDKYDSYKLGKTQNIPDRDNVYVTGEIVRGHFEEVFEVPIKKMAIVERLLQDELREFNVKINGGTEFYKKKISH